MAVFSRFMPCKSDKIGLKYIELLSRYILKYHYDLKTLQLGVDNVGVDNAGKNKIVGVDDEMGVDDVVGSGRGQ